jgi:hypothetical protein
VTVYIVPPEEVGVTATSEEVEVIVSPEEVVEIEVSAHGVAGLPGNAADEVVHSQTTPAATWLIQHDLSTKPDVRLFLTETPEERVYTDVVYVDLNNIEIIWPEPKSGWAFIR